MVCLRSTDVCVYNVVYEFLVVLNDHALLFSSILTPFLYHTFYFANGEMGTLLSVCACVLHTFCDLCNFSINDERLT